jgi:CelD/BcsL family acetyltransferase involved in cellulose biosynthesis
MSCLATRVIRTADHLEATASDWWSLWRRTPSATPFLSPAWLIPWWRSFAPGELFTVVVERGDTLVGLAPFYREAGVHGSRLMPLGIAVSDYLDVLLDPTCEREAGEALVACASATPGGWESWQWEELRPGAAALRLPVPPECRAALHPQSACPVLELASEDLPGCLPSGKRRKLRLARNRAARRAPSFERARGPAVQAALDHLFRLHECRWESQGQAGVLAGDRVQRFHRQAAPLLDAAGLARLYVLRFGDEVVATYYGFLHDLHAYAYLSGFSPEYAFESPGTLLVEHAIAEALREGTSEFHFLRGQEPYKYAWGAADRLNHRRVFCRIGRTDAAT